MHDYRRLWSWSIDEPDAFWSAVWDYVGMPHRDASDPVLTDSAMPGAEWFPGVQLNYAEEMFRHRSPDDTAVTGVDEFGIVRTLSWSELQQQVASGAAWLRAHGVGTGDAVAGYLPNSTEAVVAFLSAASVGATWGLCGLDYAGEAALARLGQLRPKVLIAAKQTHVGGRLVDRRDDVAVLREGLAEVVATAIVGVTEWDKDAASFDTVVSNAASAWSPARVPFDHPLWVLFTSGTTGKPKGLVHGHGGILLEQRKIGTLHLDLGSDDRVLWYTSPSWMMWNFLIGALQCGAEIVCYEGSAGHPGIGRLWDLARELDVTVLGTSPGYLAACRAGGIELPAPGSTGLRLLGVTGSTFTPDLHSWVADAIGDEVPIASTSGGTDVCTAFVGHSPTVASVPGELSAPCLGVNLRCFDDAGASVVGRAGELVITAPMPSMPLRILGDPDGSRYRAAYFDRYPGTWCHGDSITVTGRGSVIIHGRSDATLNRHGVRMGSGDITAPVEQLPEVAEALVIGMERPNGGYSMPLFVHLVDGHDLDENLIERLRFAIRSSTSPRHVPDEFIAVPGIPHTKTGKKLEVPIRRIFLGEDPDDCLDRRAVDDPALIDWFAALARSWQPR